MSLYHHSPRTDRTRFQENMHLAADIADSLMHKIPAIAEISAEKFAFVRSLEMMCKAGWAPEEELQFVDEVEIFGRPPVIT